MVGHSCSDADQLLGLCSHSAAIGCWASSKHLCSTATDRSAANRIEFPRPHSLTGCSKSAWRSPHPCQRWRQRRPRTGWGCRTGMPPCQPRQTPGKWRACGAGCAREGGGRGGGEWAAGVGSTGQVIVEVPPGRASQRPARTDGNRAGLLSTARAAWLSSSQQQQLALASHPAVASTVGPRLLREYMLTSRWLMPPCRKAGVMRRHHCPAYMSALACS